MKFSLAVVLLASAVAPSASLSYLESISRAAPSTTSTPEPATADAPFFFTNGSRDEPASSSGSSNPSFSFMNEPAQPANSVGSYLDNLSSSSSSVSGGGMTGYLDALAGPGASLSGGSGMAGYLDSLPKSSPVGGGAGISSYAESLNVAGALDSSYSAPASNSVATQASASVPASASAPVSFAAGSNVATTSASYLDALSASSSNSPSGGGMTGYLDALPRAPATQGGAGIPSYTANLPTMKSVSGPGLRSFTDGLSGSASASGSAFVIGSIKGTFDFSLTIDENLKQQIAQAGNRRVKLTGKVNSVSY